VVPDFTVHSKWNGRVVLAVLLRGWDVTDPDKDPERRHRARTDLADYLHDVGCRLALVVTAPMSVLVGREPHGDGEAALHDVARVRTERLLGVPADVLADDTLDGLVKAWLAKLVEPGALTLPADLPRRELFAAEVVAPSVHGRVVADKVEEHKRRLAEAQGGGRADEIRAAEVEWGDPGDSRKAPRH
jgi:hypothetical protein